MVNIEVKNLAIGYRKKGNSYSFISDKLNLSRSTLSGWLKDIPYVPNEETLLRIRLAPQKSAIIRHKKLTDDMIATRILAHTELGNLSKRDLWLLGIGLYLGINYLMALFN